MSLIDLHICKNPTESEESVSACDCPAEYYCVNDCGEGRSISTLISWQHFPRSTSSRSRCDDSSERTQQSLTVSESKTPIPQEEEKKSEQTPSTEYPIANSFAQLRVQHYLRIRYVFEFLNFLMSHLVCNEPEDPVQFLVNLLDKCLRFRDHFGDTPLLFTHAHVKSLYNAFDPFERGYLTLEQYHEAMKALGLANGPTKYNMKPPLNDEGFVSESFFIFESNHRLLENLKKMVRIPKNWEENRLRWKRRMEKIAEMKENTDADNISQYDEEEEKPYDPPDCRRATDICGCDFAPFAADANNVPEQLFLS